MKRPFLIPGIIASAGLLAATGRWPIGYYEILRWGVLGAATYGVILAYPRSAGVAWLLAGVGLMFNPISPFQFNRDVWRALDVAGAVAMAAAAFMLHPAPEAPKGDEDEGVS